MFAKFFCPNRFCVQNIFNKKNVAQKCWVQKDLGPKKVGPKKISLKNWCQNEFGVKKLQDVQQERKVTSFCKQ